METLKKYLPAATFLTTVALYVYFLGFSVSPLTKQFYTFHDETQAARIIDLVTNIKAGNIPPRIAPNWSFNLGYPAYTFYAPFSYSVPALLHTFGLDVASSLKWGFLSGMLLLFISVYLLLRFLYGHYPALVGAATAGGSLYTSLDVVVRGNIAELYAIALLPLALYFFLLLQKNIKPAVFVATCLVWAAFFVTHNLFSPFGAALLFTLAVFSPTRTLALRAFFIAIALSLFFWLPFAFEAQYTHARQVTLITDYKDHFLCLSQLWKSPDVISYGGSVPGCNDPLTFKLGKAHMTLLFISLLALFAAKWLPRKLVNTLSGGGKTALFGFIGLMTGSIFLALESSRWLWQALPPLSYVQFPWRFLSYLPLAMAGIAAAGFSTLKPLQNTLIVLAVSASIFYLNAPYFKRDNLSVADFNTQYGREFMEKKAAYQYPEPLPKTVDRSEYLRYAPGWEALPFDNKKPIESVSGITAIIYADPFNKIFILTPKSEAYINIHFYPNWIIRVNGKPYTPTVLDKLGRPLLTNTGSENWQVTVQYEQTMVEKAATLISGITFWGLIVWLLIHVKKSRLYARKRT